MTPEQQKKDQWIKERKLQAVAAYRDALRCLQARVEGISERVADLDDDDLISEMGMASKVRADALPGTWLDGPLHAMKAARATVKELNYLQAAALEIDQGLHD